MASYPLNGKVALITGAARGIGFETARLLHERGAAVTLLDVDADATAAAAAEVGERTLAIGADVRDRDAMQSAVERTVERFGGLDIPIANAGVSPPAATMRTVDAEAWERVIDINLLGVWRTVKPSLEQVVARQGHVVVISSVYAFVNGMVASPYAASKSAVESMGRSLRAELSVHGASATTVHFGFIDTAMVREKMDSGDPAAEKLKGLMPSFMQRRLTPAQAAAGIVTAIEGRRARVMLPRWWYAWYGLRGIVNPLVDAGSERRADVQEVLREADAAGRAEEREGAPAQL